MECIGLGSLGLGKGIPLVSHDGLGILISVSFCERAVPLQLGTQLDGSALRIAEAAMGPEY